MDALSQSNYLSQTQTINRSDVKATTKYSLNKIDPNYKNVEKLFHEACVKVKEGFGLKKWGFDLPEHLQNNTLPVESLAFEREILLLISKKMGIKMSHREAIEAILVAEKLQPGQTPQFQQDPANDPATQAKQKQEALI